MPSLMRLADGAAALAKRGTPVVAAMVPSAAVVPIKLRRERADEGFLMGSEYYDAPVQCRALGQATGLTRPRGKPTLTPLWPSRFPVARIPSFNERLPWK